MFQYLATYYNWVKRHPYEFVWDILAYIGGMVVLGAILIGLHAMPELICTWLGL